jgi:hypothetical protein
MGNPPGVRPQTVPSASTDTFPILPTYRTAATILDKPFPPMAPYRRSMREEDPIVRARIGLATLASQSGAIRLRTPGGTPA